MRYAFVLGICLIAVATAHAQQSIEVAVVVKQKAGEPVTDLARDDFLVQEDGKSQPVTSFETTESGGYLLKYQAPRSQPDHKYHSIKVMVKRPDLRIETRPGYYSK